MKKIIALAVAAVVAAPAMADLTLSGSIAVGYSASDAMYTSELNQAVIDLATAANTAGDITDEELEAVTEAFEKDQKGNAGFGVDTASITIAGSETLENGLTIAGSISAGGLARGNTVGGENATLSVAGGFGKVSLGAVELGDGIYAYGSSVAENFQGELTGAASNADSFRYTAPAMGMVTLSTGFTEEIGLGKGQDSSHALDLHAAIAATDSVSGFINYRPEQGVTDARTRVGVKLNTGMLVLSVAHEMNDDANDSTDTNFGADVVLGATTVGLNYGIADNGGKETGTSVGFKHALSSNVAVSGKYTQYEDGADDVTKSSVLMSLSF